MPIGILTAGIFGDSSRTGTIQGWDRHLVSGWQGHYGYPNFPPGRNVGGDFILYGNEYTNGIMPVGKIMTNGPGAYSDWFYEGSIVGKVTPLSTPFWDGENSAKPFGAEAFSKMKPTAPDFGAFNAIYELKDVPRMLQQRMVHGNLKNISNYWLALQFGWKPLLRDIRNTVKTQMGAQKRLAQLLRDEGRSVRRKVTLDETEELIDESSGTAYGSFDPGDFVTYFYSADPTHSTKVFQRSKTWASARFRYFLPPGPRDINWTRRMLAGIFGLYPSPKQVWDCVPWSWLVDWFTNLGFVIDNLDSGVADRLAAEYAYIMTKTETVRESSLTWSGWLFPDKTPFTAKTASTATAFKKFRSPIDPFGAAFSEDSLTPMQWSILGALGLSRL
jgi:hypothetical protein